jgi:hypothetical protein
MSPAGQAMQFLAAGHKIRIGILRNAEQIQMKFRRSLEEFRSDEKKIDKI